MHVDDLVSILDRPEPASIESIPVANRSFINVSVIAVARIQRDFVRAARVTDQCRSVTGGAARWRGEPAPSRILIATIGIEVKTAAVVIDQSSHHPSLAQRAHFTRCRI